MRFEGTRVISLSEVEEVGTSATSEMKIGGRPFGRGCSLRARTSGVTVAVKRRVRRDEDGGRAERHLLRSVNIEPAPEARRRSASSSTTTLARPKPPMLSLPEFCTWSASRPGVATTICGRRDKASACGRMSLPPVTRTTLRECGAPKAKNCS